MHWHSSHFPQKPLNCLENCLRLQHCPAVSYASCFPPPAETSRGVSCTCVTSSRREMEEWDLTLSISLYLSEFRRDFTALSLTGSQTLPRHPTLSGWRRATRAWPTSSSTRRMWPTCWEASTSKQVTASQLWWHHLCHIYIHVYLRLQVEVRYI